MDLIYIYLIGIPVAYYFSKLWFYIITGEGLLWKWGWVDVGYNVLLSLLSWLVIIILSFISIIVGVYVLTKKITKNWFKSDPPKWLFLPIFLNCSIDPINVIIWAITAAVVVAAIIAVVLLIILLIKILRDL